MNPAMSRRFLVGGAGITCLAAAWLTRARSAPGSAAVDEFPLDIHSLPIETRNMEARGPLIRVKRGEAVNARLANSADRPATIHWYGLRIANDMDGVGELTQQTVSPGRICDIRFVAHDAGTFFYRANLYGFKPDDVPPAFSGVLVVEEDQPPKYDREDILSFSHESRPDAADQPGFAVNRLGAWTIELQKHERLRLRLVNMSTVKTMDLAFAGIEPTIVAIDSQPVEAPFVPIGNRLVLPPCGRADLCIDGTLGEEEKGGIAVSEEGKIVELVQFRSASGKPLRDQRLPPPEPLPSNGLPARLDLPAAKLFAVSLESEPGGKTSGFGPPLFSVKQGTLVVLTLRNDNDSTSGFHLHGHTARLLHPNDDGWEPYWIDTASVGPNETIRIAFLADNPGKWALECYPGTFGAVGKAAWFEVKA